MSNDIPEPRSNRKWFRWLLLLVVVWGGGWFAGKLALQKQVHQAMSELQAQGTTITCAKESWGGFPFRYTLACTHPKLVIFGNAPPLQASAEQLSLAMWFPYPLHISARLTGPTSINGEIVNHGPAPATLSFGLTGNWSATARLPQPSYATLGHASEVQLSGSKSSRTIKLEAQGAGLEVRAPDTPALQLDKARAVAETDARLANAEDPAEVMAQNAIPIKIEALELVSGAASITADGEFTLDRNHKLNGKLASTVNDIDALMAVMAPVLKLKDGEVAAAKTVIGLIGGDPASKARKLDVIAQEGELYWGPFKFADVPPIK